MGEITEYNELRKLALTLAVQRAAAEARSQIGLFEKKRKIDVLDLANVYYGWLVSPDVHVLSTPKKKEVVNVYEDLKIPEHVANAYGLNDMQRKEEVQSSEKPKEQKKEADGKKIVWKE